MPVLKVKKNGVWEELGGTSPMDGGNADTLDGKHASEFALASDVNSRLSEKSDTNHTHDNRYYTESEIDTKLSNKSDAGHTHSYLPISGGSMRGNIVMIDGSNIDIGSGDIVMAVGSILGVGASDANDNDFVMPIIYMSPEGNIHVGRNQSETTTHDGNTYINAIKGAVYLKNSNSSMLKWFKYAGDNYNNIFRCETDVDAILGSSSCRWYRIYNSTTTCTTSDEREKSDIMHIADYPAMYVRGKEGNVFEQLFDKLIPTTYSLNFEKDDNLHIGFIAQDIEKAAEEIGLPVENIGFIVHDYWTDEETGEEKDRYSLGYEQFIALNTYMIQKQKAKIASLEDRIAKLESIINTES